MGMKQNYISKKVKSVFLKTFVRYPQLLQMKMLCWWMDLIFSLCCFFCDFAENQNTSAVYHVLHVPFNVRYGWKQKQWGRGGALLCQQLCDGVQDPGRQYIRYSTVILTIRLLFVFVLLFALSVYNTVPALRESSNSVIFDNVPLRQSPWKLKMSSDLKVSVELSEQDYSTPTKPQSLVFTLRLFVTYVWCLYLCY